jgi:type II secretory pathway pseudopilin PulG
MLLVVAIVAILASILIPSFLRARTNASVAASKTGMRNLATALETYFVDNRVYPTDPTLSILVTGNYLVGIPVDSCTRQAYVYTPTGATYIMNTPSWAATMCTIIANGLSWTPEGGLVQY